MSSMKRMTANPVKPKRYRPGKALPEVESSDEYESEVEDEELLEQQAPAGIDVKPPISVGKGLSNLSAIATKSPKDADIAIRQREDQEKRQIAALTRARRNITDYDDPFDKKESEEESEGSYETDSEEGSSVEEEESEEEHGPLIKPTFLRKDQRKAPVPLTTQSTNDEWADAAKEAQRKKEADDMLQDQLIRDAEARAADRRGWDDDEEGTLEEVDDTDDLDPEAEYAAWRLRELKRIKRDREVIEEAEKERAEVERRKGLPAVEREAEDAEYLKKQRSEKDSRGTMGFMQRYHHKGAFFRDDEGAEDLGNRDLMGARFQDQRNMELLPEYMQVRDATKLGRKGRTKYKDMRAEDTGSWGVDTARRRGEKRDWDRGGDSRFAPDYDQDRDKGDKRPRYA